MIKLIFKLFAVGITIFMTYMIITSLRSRSLATSQLTSFYNSSYTHCMMQCSETFANRPTDALLCHHNCLKIEELFPGGCESIIKVQEAAKVSVINSHSGTIYNILPVRTIEAAIEMRNPR